MNRKSILITGCSSGIGFDTALALKAQHYDVIASCRKEADLIRLKDLGLNAIQLDLNDSKSINGAYEQVIKHTGGGLDVLINNAGYCQAGALEDIRQDLIEKQFQTNVFGLLELTNLFIPIMRKQKSGRIINISSILGHVSLPFRGAYNASKYALEGLCDTLRLELFASGIKVVTIVPGPIESSFRDKTVDVALQQVNMEESYFKNQYRTMLSSFKEKKEKSFFTKDTHAVIKKIFHAIESKRPKRKYYVTLPTYLLLILKRLFPVILVDKVLYMISKKEISE